MKIVNFGQRLKCGEGKIGAEIDVIKAGPCLPELTPLSAFVKSNFMGIIGALGLSNAPIGYESEDGFHFGEPGQHQKYKFRGSTATDAEPVKGEELLESEELKRQLREAKERLTSGEANSSKAGPEGQKDC